MGKQLGTLIAFFVLLTLPLPAQAGVAGDQSCVIRTKAERERIRRFWEAEKKAKAARREAKKKAKEAKKAAERQAKEAQRQAKETEKEMDKEAQGADRSQK